MRKTIDFFGKKITWKNAFPGACFLRYGIFNGALGSKETLFFAIPVAVIAPGK
jgi:hypothetical protein